MRLNPIVPYILIMVFGIGLVFFLSLYGEGNKSEVAKDGTEATQGNGDTSEGDAGGADLVASCIGCHGGDLTGGIGPSLIGQDPDHIVDVLVNGIPDTPMTPGMKSEAEAKQIAEYISSLK